jgi:hypothetical protein
LGRRTAAEVEEGVQVADPCFEVGVEVFAGEVHDGAMLSHDAVSFSPPALSIWIWKAIF